jgi:hypothetical protein
MTRTELRGRRWAAQGLNRTTPGGAVETVGRLGAVQAQDPKMVLAAVALRCPALTAAAVASALDSGALVRTHVLRPTWHLVAAADLRWMTALTAGRIKGAAGSNQRARGVDAEVLLKAERVLEAALKDGPQTREVLVDALKAAGLAVDENRAAHYLMNAELDLILCNGPWGRKPTYDLVDRRVPAAAPVPRDEALATLAVRYITGHGPATDRDFAWWSGLNLTDARLGLAASQGILSRGSYGDAEVWYDPQGGCGLGEGLAFLPAFDEYLIAFADRSAAIDEADASRWVTKNGIFHPVAVEAGRVVGRWRPNPKGSVGVEWFDKAPAGAGAGLARFTHWWDQFGPGGPSA